MLPTYVLEDRGILELYLSCRIRFMEMRMQLPNISAPVGVSREGEVPEVAVTSPFPAPYVQ